MKQAQNRQNEKIQTIYKKQELVNGDTSDRKHKNRHICKVTRQKREEKKRNNVTKKHPTLTIQNPTLQALANGNTVKD